MDITKLIQVGTEENVVEQFGEIEKWYKEQEQEREKIAKELNISIAFADDVMYLRTRQRHTPQLEKELIDKLTRGEDVNIMEFGVTAETQANLTSIVDQIRTRTAGSTSRVNETKDNNDG